MFAQQLSNPTVYLKSKVSSRIKSWKVLVLEKLSSQRLVLKSPQKEAFIINEKLLGI